MRRLRVLGGCLALAVAACAIAAPNAFAEHPKWRTCVKSVKFSGHGTGYFTDSACSQVSETHEGGYEEATWGAGQKVALKGKGGKTVFGVYVPVTENGKVEAKSLGIAWKLECAKNTSVGEITGPREGWLQVTFSKCSATAEPGGAPVKCMGKIETGHLPTKLESFSNVYKKNGGAELEIGEEYPAPVASFDCGSTRFELTGGIGDPEIKEPALNVACSKTTVLSFRVGEGGVAEPYSPEPGETGGRSQGPGFPIMVINGELFGAGLETTETLKSKSTLCDGEREPNT